MPPSVGVAPHGIGTAQAFQVDAVARTVPASRWGGTCWRRRSWRPLCSPGWGERRRALPYRGDPGFGRRRRCTSGDKARTVAESLDRRRPPRRWPGATGCTRASSSS